MAFFLVVTWTVEGPRASTSVPQFFLVVYLHFTRSSRSDSSENCERREKDATSEASRKKGFFIVRAVKGTSFER